jgi:hypothetical protein
MNHFPRPFKAASLAVSLTWWFAFGTSLSAVGQGVATADTPAELMLLSDYTNNGRALRKVIPLDKLPPRITFKKGDISLVPDPLDRSGPLGDGPDESYLVVYLVNDTDEPIPEIVGERQNVRSQVRFGGNWYSREPMRTGCASVLPPTDLPARCALALAGLSDQRGDTGGEIRYGFSISNRTITSEPQRGRYFAADLQEVLADEELYPDLWLIDEGFFKQQWKEPMVATNDEEFCALVELVRHHQLAVRERAVLMDWLLERAARHDATPEQQRVIRRLQGSLAKPWLIDNDGQILADRCIAALESAPSKVYGTPEKCRACVWRFVAARFPGRQAVWHGHESKSADDASVARLVELAKAALASSDPDIADAAAGFLGKGRITEAMFPSAELVRLLETDRPLRIRAGLNGLASRKRVSDAAPWLLARVTANDPHLGDYYEICSPRLKGEVEDWERAVLLQLIEVAPLRTLAKLRWTVLRFRETKPPPDVIASVRRYLNEQLTDERKRWWQEAGERAKRGQLERVHDMNCQGLSGGIEFLGSLDDPVDVPLLQAMLEHPAEHQATYSDGSKRVWFVARDAAKSCLHRRHLKVPQSVVTAIEIKAPAPPQDRWEECATILRYHERFITATSLGVLSVASLTLWRIRARQRRRAAGTAIGTAA